ncbi:MAG TPA: SRPBCC family protein [Jatrophihabitans sp.]|jgi:uncharacterized protein YndB with AHSA1/START domain|nr:SRPBCC family protein [Jatrophihabitans sp.]
MNDLHLSSVPTVNAGMLIRRPPESVFQAFADPAITTRFWFTKSSGKLEPGAKVRWDWEMYGASAKVTVKEFEENRRIVFDWGSEESSTTVELRFIPFHDDTYLQVTENGFTGSGDEVVARVADSTGGFTMTLSAAKALLEHDVVLTVVADKAPPGLEL